MGRGKEEEKVKREEKADFRSLSVLPMSLPFIFPLLLFDFLFAILLFILFSLFGYFSQPFLCGACSVF